jgi:hypothetical protein
MTKARRIAVAACALAMVLDTACYAYRPLGGAPPAENQRVRLHLSTEGTTELARYLGPRIAVAEGTVASTRPDGALIVAVDWVQTIDGARQPWTGEGVVSFPATLVTAAEQSILDRSRTTTAVLALTTGLVALAATALRSTSAQGGTGPGAGPLP